MNQEKIYFEKQVLMKIFNNVRKTIDYFFKINRLNCTSVKSIDWIEKWPIDFT